MKLYTYQEELVNSKSDRIIINWCRGAGQTTAIVEYILANEFPSVLMDSRVFQSVVRYLKNNNKNLALDIVFNNNTIKIFFKKFPGVILIQKCIPSYDINYKDYDLFVFENDIANEENLGLKKVIKVMTDNIDNIRFTYNKNLYETSVVDYKDAMKENALPADFVIQAALDNNKDSFYKEYAIKDKPKQEKMSFDTFKDQAIQRLQKQFLTINDSKDTVLTRKNIVEMIKDLKTIN